MKIRFHYAWLIFAGCCCMTAGGFALVYSVAGVYLLPVSTSLGISTADVSMWLTADGVMALAAMPLAGYLLQKRSIGRYMTMGALFVVAGVFGFSLCSEMPHFILCGCLIGFGMPYLYGIAETTLIGNWFAVRHQGKFLGVAMACLAVGAAVWAPLLTHLVQSMGWQQAYRINAVLIAFMILPWTLFVFKRDPADMGLRPYGIDDADAQRAGGVSGTDAHVGMGTRAAFKTVAFWMVLLAACTTCLGMGFENHQPAIADEFLVPWATDAAGAALFGGWMISVAALGQAVGTLAFGALVDRFDMRLVFGCFLVLFACAFVAWGVVGGEAGLLVGALLLGTHGGLASVGYPLLTRRLFGGRCFSRIYAVVNMTCAFLGGWATTLVSLTYDVFGTYHQVILAAVVMVAFLATFSFVAIGRIGKQAWSKEADAQAAAAPQA